MTSYGIYHPASGKFVSNYIHHLNGRYEIQLANDIQDTRIWAKKKSAELQFKQLLNDPDEDVRVEVAKHGFGLDILKNDKSRYVQAEAKLQLAKKKDLKYANT